MCWWGGGLCGAQLVPRSKRSRSAWRMPGRVACLLMDPAFYSVLERTCPSIPASPPAVCPHTLAGRHEPRGGQRPRPTTAHHLAVCCNCRAIAYAVYMNIKLRRPPSVRPAPKPGCTAPCRLVDMLGKDDTFIKAQLLQPASHRYTCKTSCGGTLSLAQPAATMTAEIEALQGLWTGEGWTGGGLMQGKPHGHFLRCNKCGDCWAPIQFVSMP